MSTFQPTYGKNQSLVLDFSWYKTTFWIVFVLASIYWNGSALPMAITFTMSITFSWILVKISFHQRCSFIWLENLPQYPGFIPISDVQSSEPNWSQVNDKPPGRSDKAQHWSDVSASSACADSQPPQLSGWRWLEAWTRNIFKVQMWLETRSRRWSIFRAMKWLMVFFARQHWHRWFFNENCDHMKVPFWKENIVNLNDQWF